MWFRLTEHPDMTTAVYRGCETTILIQVPGRYQVEKEEKINLNGSFCLVRVHLFIPPNVANQMLNLNKL